VANVLTLVRTKQIRINIHKGNNKKHSTNNKKHSKYKYTYYQNTHIYTPTHYKTHKLQYQHITKPTHYKTHTYTHPHITKSTNYKTHTLQNLHITKPTYYKTHTLRNQLTQPQYKIHTKWNSYSTIKYPQYKVPLMYMVILSPRTSSQLTSFHFKTKSLHINHVSSLHLTTLHFNYIHSVPTVLSINIANNV
jgi:hypothetical protein